MAEGVLLKFQFNGVDVDVMVDDIDKVNLIDLIVEYLDNAEKQNIVQPKYRKFTYLYKMKHVNLESDKDLMTMFCNLPENKEIWIWVDGLHETTELLNSAFHLRGVQSSNPTPQTVTIQPEAPLVPCTKSKPVTKLIPRRSARLTIGPYDDQCGQNEPPEIVEFASFYEEGYYNNIDLDETFVNKELALVDVPKGRGRGRGRPKGMTMDKGKGKMKVPQGKGKMKVPEIILLRDGKDDEVLL